MKLTNTKAAAVAAGLVAAVTMIVLAFLWPTHTMSPHNIPVAVAGPEQAVSQVENTLEEQSPGTFDFHAVATRDEAVNLIEQRDVLGAIVVGQQPEVLTTTAGSTAVSQMLNGVAGGLGAHMHTEVATTDVVPLASSDQAGSGLAAAAFPMVIGGMLGGILTSLLAGGRKQALIMLAVYAPLAGLVISAVLGPWFGILQGNYFADAAAIALTLGAMAVTIVSLKSLLGQIGLSIGAITFFLIGNPISAAAYPHQFLPGIWGEIGQLLPPGAGATLLRTLSYFPDASTATQWITLGLWALAGLILLLVGHKMGNKKQEKELNNKPAMA